MRASPLPLRIVFCLVVALLSLAWPAGPVLARGNHIAAELVAEGPGQPGGTVMMSLHFRPEPGWHGYWSNPGDAGYGMELDWSLPSGAKAGEPEYPVPQTLLIGGLMNHVYEGGYAVLVPVTLPRTLDSDSVVAVSVDASWLACTDKICVPEGARLEAPVSMGGPGGRDPRFDRWRAAIPPVLGAAAHYQLAGGMLRVGIPLPGDLPVPDPHLFVGTPDLVRYAAAQGFAWNGDRLIVEVPAVADARVPAPYGKVTGMLRLAGGEGYAFVATPGEVPRGVRPVTPAGEGSGLGWLVAAAFAGGLLLNLMPCVFPILSLKALSLARAGESERQARHEGLAYTTGAVLAAVALGVLLLVLRAGGEQVGWAFQLQEPGVVAGLFLLAVAITANFAGLFELPWLSVNRGGESMGAFATGMLAAFVATPCTGPFMAAALGAALLLPPLPALALFAALGLGLALPFLLLGFVPPLRRLLPRPGPWMERFRHWLAVPMGLTALALLWLADRLAGATFAAVAAAAAIALVLVLSVLGRRQRAGGGSWRAWVLAAVPLGLAALVLPAAAGGGAEAEAGVLAPQVFSEAGLERARQSGRPVFVWFTADWCITCKVNEGVAIERVAVRNAFEKHRVVALRGDWTRRDPAITRFLTAHGVAGVPLYLWYEPGRTQAERLPQILGPDALVTLAERRRPRPSQLAGTPATAAKAPR